MNIHYSTLCFTRDLLTLFIQLGTGTCSNCIRSLLYYILSSRLLNALDFSVLTLSHSIILFFIPISNITYSYYNQLIYSFTRSSTHLFIYSFIHSFIHSFINSIIHSFIHSIIHSFIHSIIHSFINSIINLLIY